MPTSNLFNRTAFFCRERSSDGSIRRIKRIPWDLIQFGSGNGGGPFISPMPVSLNSLSDVVTTTTINGNVVDMLFEDNEPGQIDEIIDIQWLESENDLIAKFDATFGYYDGNESQSQEFGYPMTP
jgi:hypothetical protein